MNGEWQIETDIPHKNLAQLNLSVNFSPKCVTNEINEENEERDNKEPKHMEKQFSASLQSQGRPLKWNW